MKVVLFCGGLGMRLREYSETIPKPMVKVGLQPILWYVMKYYAHYGHNDFILCLGYRGDVIKKFFLDYNEALSNDFVLNGGDGKVQLYNSDIHDWKITFVDTGQNSNVGERLKAVEKYLDGEEMFLANYSDGVSNLPLDKYLEFFKASKKIGSFVSVRSNQSFHVVDKDESGLVSNIRYVGDSVTINGGFFAFKKEIFDHINDGEELVMEPFQRLIAKKELITYDFNGFWACMDTFKDKQNFDDMYARGETPWVLW